MVAQEPILTIAVRRSEFAKRPFEFELQDQAGRPHISVVSSSFNPHSIVTSQQEFKDNLFELLSTIFARIIVTNDLQQVLERLFRDERALDRSINFTGSFGTVANVLGHDPKSQVSSWSDPKATEYFPKRTNAWDADDIGAEKKADAKGRLLTGEGEPPPELRDLGRVKQNEIRTVSLIRNTLWDKAKWVGTVFATPADGASPPILALAFKDEEAAKQIFRFWRDELGAHDSEEQLRVAIVRGISKARPHSYRVLIGSNPGIRFSQQDIRYAAFISRINTMQPVSDANLERFLPSYGKFKGYFLMAAVWKGEAFEPELTYDPTLFKRELFVRWAWEIGRNDPDGVAIQDDDTPIIPAGQENPPILEFLQRKQEKRKS
jgi:hypothetical protein